MAGHATLMNPFLVARRERSPLWLNKMVAAGGFIFFSQPALTINAVCTRLFKNEKKGSLKNYHFTNALRVETKAASGNPMVLLVTTGVMV